MRRLLGACVRLFGCMSMERLGAKYAVVECMHVYGEFWVQVCGCWVQVYGAVGCLPDCLGFA